MAAIAVKADAGSAQEGLGFLFEGGEGLGQHGCALHAAVAKFLFLFLVPAAAGEIFAGEVDDGAGAFEGGGIEGIGERVPGDAGRRGSGAADQRDYFDVGMGVLEMRRERAADQAGGAAEDDFGLGNGLGHRKILR